MTLNSKEEFETDCLVHDLIQVFKHVLSQPLEAIGTSTDFKDSQSQAWILRAAVWFHTLKWVFMFYFWFKNESSENHLFKVLNDQKKWRLNWL